MPDLLAPHVEVHNGPDAGRCYLCGRDTPRGFREPPSDTFSAWAQCSAGDVLCPHCRAALKAPTRRSSWLLTAERWRVTSAEDKGWMLRAMLDPPAPPTAWYLTRGRQKQGWLSIIWRVTEGREALWVGVDWQEAAVRLPVAWAREQAPLLRRMRERKVWKAALATGEYHAGHWSRAIQQGWEADLRAALALAKDPRWEVLCEAT